MPEILPVSNSDRDPPSFQEPSVQLSSPKPLPFFSRWRTWSLLLLLVLLVGYGIWTFVSKQRFASNYQRILRSIAIGQYSIASVQVAELLKENPNHPDLLLLAIRTTRGLSEWEAAERILEKYISIQGLDDQALIQRALIRAEQGNVDRVRSFLLTRTDQNPTARLEVLEAFIKGCLSSYRFTEMEEYIDQWLRLDSNDPKLHFLMGQMYELLDSTKSAIGSYQKVLEFCPEHSDARTRLVRLLLAINDSESARDHCEVIKRQGLETSETKILYAQSLIQLGQQTSAHQLVKEILQSDPHNSSTLTEMAKIAMQNGDDIQAQKMLKEVVDREPGNTKARYQYVLCLQKLGRDQEAKQQNERLTQMDKDLQRIRVIVTREMQNRPNDPQLRFEVGMIAMRAGLAREGARWLKTVLELDPHHSGAHEALAGYYQVIGNSGLAARHLDLAHPAKRFTE
jgi:tetratricopeptide (TPR) repeat protein